MKKFFLFCFGFACISLRYRESLKGLKGRNCLQVIFTAIVGHRSREKMLECHSILSQHRSWTLVIFAGEGDLKALMKEEASRQA